MRAALLHGMWGLGDNIFQRAIVRNLLKREQTLYLETPWPELYEDLPIAGFVLADRRLRTQLKNVSRQPASRWRKFPGGKEYRNSYGPYLERSNILRGMESTLGIPSDPLLLDLPVFNDLEIVSHRPIALIRPVTVRSEWRNEARNPLPEYVNAIADRLYETHHVVVVADVVAGQEWLVGSPPRSHQSFLSGQLNVRQLMTLIQRSDILVGGVGWIVPASIAAKVKCFCILGGQGGHNAPARVTDPRLDLSKLGFAIPENFHTCTKMMCTQCDKTIPNLMEQYERWMRQCSSFLVTSGVVSRERGFNGYQSLELATTQ